jgi:hypothetical protein
MRLGCSREPTGLDLRAEREVCRQSLQVQVKMSRGCDARPWSRSNLELWGLSARVMFT